MGKFLCYAVKKDGKFYNIESKQFTDFLTGDCIFDSKENAEKIAEDSAAELKEIACHSEKIN